MEPSYVDEVTQKIENVRQSWMLHRKALGGSKAIDGSMVKQMQNATSGNGTTAEGGSPTGTSRNIAFMSTTAHPNTGSFSASSSASSASSSSSVIPTLMLSGHGGRSGGGGVAGDGIDSSRLLLGEGEGSIPLAKEEALNQFDHHYKQQQLQHYQTQTQYQAQVSSPSGLLQSNSQPPFGMVADDANEELQMESAYRAAHLQLQKECSEAEADQLVVHASQSAASAATSAAAVVSTPTIKDMDMNSQISASQSKEGCGGGSDSAGLRHESDSQPVTTLSSSMVLDKRLLSDSARDKGGKKDRRGSRGIASTSRMSVGISTPVSGKTGFSSIHTLSAPPPSVTPPPAAAAITAAMAAATRRRATAQRVAYLQVTFRFSFHERKVDNRR